MTACAWDDNNSLCSGGRLAFLLPAAVLHADYAGPVLAHLGRRAREVQLVEVRSGATARVRIGVVTGANHFFVWPRADVMAFEAEGASSVGVVSRAGCRAGSA